MADVDYEACRYSVTVRTDDPAVLHMLRGLTQQCESGRFKQIAWGGTGERDWAVADHEVTFRFSAPTDRSRFRSEARRLLPDGSWTELRSDDNDPATRQRS
ncbi:hypothetical protein [Jiangella anatolica]|uniref:Uncharacterized protein n=1 Tax=Jiangella anatolica TaxID=2670374 RepID=A0A2W2B7V1_9ACTN|nr:hypothetical protein [Jiangella anatolica]PZF83551.1 hypothetical protein C1I92_12315 [Jiangella anatolica]